MDILVQKKERKRKCGCLFRPKNKTPENKEMRFLAPKNKKKTIFGRPLLLTNFKNVFITSTTRDQCTNFLKYELSLMMMAWKQKSQQRNRSSALVKSRDALPFIATARSKNLPTSNPTPYTLQLDFHRFSSFLKTKTKITHLAATVFVCN